MGIKNLNKFLQTECSESIENIHLSKLSGKKIVVDTSIYLYRYMKQDSLLEKFYLMISIFRQYNITPLFIFDGKPPIEKTNLLKQRRLEKKEAEQKYNLLKNTLDNAVNENDKQEIKYNMDCLKKQFIRIRHTDTENVKTLIKAYGASYIDAPGEADKLCAKMVCKKKAYACLSEDMDLFVYGCNRVIRYLSLLQKTAIIYDLSSILKKMEVTLQEFQYICIVSGTDYNCDVKNGTNLMTTLKYFKRYKKSDSIDFYEWLEENTKYVDNIYQLYNIIDLFSLSNMVEYKKYENIKNILGPINMDNLKDIMATENFLFIE